MHLHDPPDDNAVGEQVIVVLVPLAGWAESLCAFEDQRHELLHSRPQLGQGCECRGASLAKWSRIGALCWAIPRASLHIIRPTAAKPQLNEFTGLKLAPPAA